MQSKLSKYFAKSSTPIKATKDVMEVVDLTLAENDEGSSSISALTLPEAKLDPARHEKTMAAVLNHFEYIEREDRGRAEPAVPSSSSSYTPLEKQVVDLRKKHPGCLLMVECGYKVRFFGEDATAAAKVLGIYCHPDHNFMVASIPTHRTLVHCKRLVQAGYKVAVVRQSETAAIKKSGKGSSSRTFERAVAGVFTLATMIDEDDPAFRGFGTAENKSKDKAEESDENDDEEDPAVAATDDPSLSQEDVEKDSAWIVSLYEGNESSTLLLSALNVCAAELNLIQIPIDAIRQGLQDQLDDLKCAEVIVQDDMSEDSLKPLKQRHFADNCVASVKTSTSSSSNGDSKYIKQLISYKNAEAELGKCRSLLQLYSQGDAEVLAFAPSLALMRKYLVEFGLEDALSNPHVRVTLGGKGRKGSFALDSITARDLEVFTTTSLVHDKSNRKIGYGSLFWLIDRCKSNFGRRTLKSWLSSPLTSRDEILARQETVAWISELDRHRPQYCKLIKFISECFAKFPNIERTLSSLQFGRISVQAMQTLLLFAMRLQYITVGDHDESLMPTLLKAWIKEIGGQKIALEARNYYNKLINGENQGDNKASISSIFTTEAETNIPELHRLANEQALARANMDTILAGIRIELRLPALQFSTLRTGPTSELENLIELPNNFPRPIPDKWTKVSGTKQVMRFHTPDILKAQQELHRIRDEIKIVTDQVWLRFALEIKDKIYALLRAAIQILSNIDAILSLADVAKYSDYVRPVYPEGSDEVDIRNGRHPMLSKVLEDKGEAFVPNDVELRRNFLLRSSQVLTGPNMGGKSSYVRMLGCISLLGQIGSYVPAESASLCIFDNIFTRMGAEDDLSAGRSTFMCELMRTAKILRNATNKSMVIVDELGRGTSTNDGCAIALATLKHFIHKIGCLTVFVTHYPEISKYVTKQFNDHQGRTCNAHMSYLESEESNGDTGKQVVFLYKLVDGPSEGSYGINVARLAGIPLHILRKASEMSQWMQNKTANIEHTQKRARIDDSSSLQSR